MTSGNFEVCNLHVRLGGRNVLREISFSAQAGALIALVGPSGAGKTTLLRALAGLIPSEGGIVMAGENLRALSVAQRAQKLAYVPQDDAVHWPLPVRDVVALGRYPHGATRPGRLRPRDVEAIARALDAVDLGDMAERAVTQLSGGERRRVAVARALATEAPVLFADEPTASVDPHYQLSIMTLLRRQARQGALVFVVTHDLGAAARFADRVLMLRAGRLEEAGAPRDVLAPAQLAEVFAIDAFRCDHASEPVIVPWAAR
ncbi:iron complex transport system ATP-binding protein [Rhodoblastus acidophilus]|uniref:Iron complex transport system ATP-binding protein n=1 Tax=Rhodoblastus acidophilus TaxID=1074 RepID=A0A212PZI6_RHOAC|nr:ABC transporter ATP-binding protein [Rhodoblastus acidophilus]PPQ36597.1 ABC transporter ATP-binding protein [Rhodoblastus acidophilus]RAI17099.1 ABC transporter ATP-binding protein [Rhodoblastus acidophilus]SNB52466.1 iron complex transport system ATP-binding protein [Rhodoblastus acidophilus]